MSERERVLTGVDVAQESGPALHSDFSDDQPGAKKVFPRNCTRLVARLRPVVEEPSLQLRTFAGEPGQADWADFAEVRHQATVASSLGGVWMSSARASWLISFVPYVIASCRPSRCRRNEPVVIVVIGRYPIQLNSAADFVCLCHHRNVESSRFPALLTFAQRARCAAAILLRPAALIVSCACLVLLIHQHPGAP